MPPRFFIGVASRDHVLRGVAGGFCQLCHGKAAQLKRMADGDWIAYYSPSTEFKSGVALQEFTAIGKIKAGNAYEVEMTPGFFPFRKDVAFVASAKPAKVRPLLDKLAFLKDKGNKWGSAFRFGHLEVTREDFQIIANAMGVEIDSRELEERDPDPATAAPAAPTEQPTRKRARVEP